MKRPQSPPEIPRTGGPAPSLLLAAKGYLKAVKEQALDELRQYPAPVTACDAQFNYLLERRDAASEELALLDSISEAVGSEAGRNQAVRDLILSSRLIDPESRTRLLAHCAEQAGGS
jgi:hypothetical protein